MTDGHYVGSSHIGLIIIVFIIDNIHVLLQQVNYHTELGLAHGLSFIIDTKGR